MTDAEKIAKLEADVERMRAALEPFAEIGSLLFARRLPDETPVVEVGTLSGATALTRGHFKAAHLASCDDEQRAYISDHYRAT